MPGDIENSVLEQRRRDGVPLSAALLAQLKGIAEGLGVPFHLEAAAAVSH
jgi:LDH2 family malate/lactate/ureidoglycolate dehydrogenase